MTIEELKIDPKFRDLIPKLTDAEYAQLEKNILEDGRVKEPIIVWNKTIVDGHHRYYILQKHPELPHTIEEKEFPNEHAVMAWICKTQLGRRNLKDHDREYLIGKQYDEEKLAYGTNRYTPRSKASERSYLIGEQYESEKEIKIKSPHNDDSIKPVGKTNERLAKEHGIGRASVERNAKYAEGVDIAEKIVPGMKDKILHGEVDAPKSVIQKISKVTPDKQRKATIALSNKDIESAKKALDMDGESTLEKYGLKDTGEEISFTKDDLMNEISANLSNFISAIKQSIELHKEILTANSDNVIDDIGDLFKLEVGKFMEELRNEKI